MSESAGADTGNQDDDIAGYGQGTGQTAPEPGVIDQIGNVLGAVVGGLLSALSASVGNMFDDSGADAQTIMGLSGYPIGSINMPGSQVPQGTSLADALAQAHATVNADGSITTANGNQIGSLTGGTVLDIQGINSTTNGATIGPNVANGVSGPQTISDFSVTVTVDGGGGTGIDDGIDDGVDVGIMSADIWNQITAFVSPTTGHVAKINWPAQRKWNSIGFNSSIGVPLVDYSNIVKMYSKQNSFMLPGFVGGLDGIYSLRTGQRVVPPQGPNYPTPMGFSIGQYANYAESYLLLAMSSGGRGVLMGGTGDFINIIDPTTGKTLVPAAYAWVKIFNGSQQINLVLLPTYQYAGPNPTAANPGYNSISSKVLLISEAMKNNAAVTMSEYIQMNPAANPGGPG